MGILRRIVGLLVVAFGFWIGAVSAQDASPTAPVGNIVVVESAFVRSGPGDEFVPVGALYAGDKVSPLNISEDGFWILIPYSRGNGWIQRNLVQWEDNAALDLLPVMPAEITPTPRIEVTNTPFIPTFTPVGNYVNPSNAQSVYVRAGPGRGYLRLGQLRPSDTVTPVARNEDTTWIMIRFQLSPLRQGFGWVATDLITWENFESLSELPVIEESSLTPTSTSAASITPSATGTLPASPTPSPSSTATATIEASSTDNPTTAPSETAEPTETNTATDSPTNTLEPSATATSTATNTPEPSTTPSATNTATDFPTNTLEPSATATSTATNTPEPSTTPSATNTATDFPTSTPEPSATATETALPTETPMTEAAVVVVFPSETPTDAPSNTPEPSPSPSETSAPTDIFAVQNTVVAVNATAESSPIPSLEATDLPLIEETAPESSFSIPLEAIVGLILLLLVAIYIGLYMQGLNAASRYKAGFVVDKCPVCQRGHLHVEERPNRLLGIPMVRRTVRCDECRSVLRETGNRRWRYAVDRIENPVMFDRFNGREVTDADLERLLKQPPKNANARTNPTFVDDEQGN